MIVIDKKIKLSLLAKMAEGMFGDLVKAVVDIEKGIMVVGGELHADEEAILVKSGSKQENLWGINIYPKDKNNLIEFDSMINLRPSCGNLTRGIDSLDIKQKIKKIVSNLTEDDLST